MPIALSALNTPPAVVEIQPVGKPIKVDIPLRNDDQKQLQGVCLQTQPMENEKTLTSGESKGTQ